MEARVLIADVKPGEMDDFVRFWEGSCPACGPGSPSTPEEVRNLPGSRGFLVMTDENANRAVCVSLWETPADLEGSNAFFTAHAEEFGQHLANRPEPLNCRVTTDVLPPKASG